MPACAECGYDYQSLDRDHILQVVPSLAEEHKLLLSSTDPLRLRAHPRPASWSVLEYGCHVRDVLRFQRERVLLAQVEQMPAFASMRRDERAVEDRYNDQDPVLVAGQITATAGRFADALRGLDDAGWRRTGLYPWPEPAVRSVEWISQRTAHELAHHLFDERRLLDARR